MSGVWNTSRRWWGFAPEGQGEKSGANRRLGRNDDPYYGPTLDALHASKHGTKKVSRVLGEQGAVTKKGRYVALSGGDPAKTARASKVLGG